MRVEDEEEREQELEKEDRLREQLFNRKIGQVGAKLGQAQLKLKLELGLTSLRICFIKLTNKNTNYLPACLFTNFCLLAYLLT